MEFFQSRPPIIMPLTGYARPLRTVDIVGAMLTKEDSRSEILYVDKRRGAQRSVSKAPRTLALTLGDENHRKDGGARLAYRRIRRQAAQDAVPLEEREQAQSSRDDPADEYRPVYQVSHALRPKDGSPSVVVVAVARSSRRTRHLPREQGLHRHRERFAYLGGREAELER
jgi:hypothetical protein